MQDTQAFGPLYRNTNAAVNPAVAGGFYTSVTVTATNASATASGAIPGAQNPGPSQIQVANTTSAWAYVNFGVLGQLAAATVAASYPVPPGTAVVVTVPPEVNAASVILGGAPSGSALVTFTRGAGV